jgi:hypothetical protein
VPRFVLLDHSLSGYVGHHHAYARLLLAAARKAGFQPVLAANRRLGNPGPDFPEVEIHRTFRFSTYCRHTYDSGHRTAGASGVLAGVAAVATRLARAVRIRSFAAGCAALFRRVPLEEGDVVFAATMSELDFAGLSVWLAAEPATRRVSWHVQFHLNLFRGREGDYARQERLAAKVRGVLLRTLAPLDGHRLRLYCTTEPLARQYERLGVGRFQVLPYPIDEAFAPRVGSTEEVRPLRVAFLGHSRREKGYSQLHRLLDELWEPHLRTGRVQLVVQARPGRGRVALPHDAPKGIEPVVFAPVGLPRERYVELVRNTDIGLLLYDAERYYTRCSGVLLEMLCAGVSVLVPAGSWLAEQIAEPIQLHLDALAGANVPEFSVASRASFDVTPARVDFDLETPARDLIVSCAWNAPLAPGVYVSLEVRQLDAAGAEIGSSLHVLGPREDGLPVRALVRVVEGACRLGLSLHNAYGDAPVTLQRLTATRIASATAVPGGAVGQIVADPGEAPSLVREMIEHHEHYRRTSAEFAAACRARHHAAKVLRHLLAE